MRTCPLAERPAAGGAPGLLSSLTVSTGVHVAALVVVAGLTGGEAPRPVATMTVTLVSSADGPEATGTSDRGTDGPRASTPDMPSASATSEALQVEEAMAKPSDVSGEAQGRPATHRPPTAAPPRPRPRPYAPPDAFVVPEEPASMPTGPAVAREEPAAADRDDGAAAGAQRDLRQGSDDGRGAGGSHSFGARDGSGRPGHGGDVDARPATGVGGNPEPRYPLAARRRGQEGRVVLLVHVDASGGAAEVAVERSSGFPLLDRAAIDAVRQWSFVPARASGRPVPGRVEVPVIFELTGR